MLKLTYCDWQTKSISLAWVLNCRLCMRSYEYEYNIAREYMHVLACIWKIVCFLFTWLLLLLFFFSSLVMSCHLCTFGWLNEFQQRTIHKHNKCAMQISRFFPYMYDDTVANFEGDCLPKVLAKMTGRPGYPYHLSHLLNIYIQCIHYVRKEEGFSWKQKFQYSTVFVRFNFRCTRPPIQLCTLTNVFYSLLMPYSCRRKWLTLFSYLTWKYK